MSKPDSNHDFASNDKLASFYYLAEDIEKVEEQEISPSLHAISQIADRYESAEFIAKGGMKQVFKVYDARCKRNVAMATLHDDAPTELSDPLIHEAWLTGLLDHPNIITIHDVGVDSRNRPYFTMDLKSGDSLSQLIEKLDSGDRDATDRYPLDSLLEVFVKICDAIAYAHSVQVLHLDLKPANIQVGEYGEVLVCDWGLGRVQRSDDGIEFERLLLHSDLLSSNTLFGEVRGTPGYMAPEQIQQDGIRDARTDIYQLGCILYSIMTLKRPLEGDPSKALEKAARGEIIQPRERAPDRNIPASLAAVVSKAMAVDPDSRYASVESLGEEVRRYLTGFATQAEDAGVLTQLGLLYKRNKRFCWTVLCSGLVLLCGAVWSYLQLSASRDFAEQKVALYEAGRGALDRMSTENANSVERVVIEMHLAADESTAEKLLQTALAAEPDNPVYLRAMGEHYFIVQRFNQAAEFLDQGEKRDEYPDQLINDLAHEYAAIKPDDDQKLTTQQVVRLLNRIENFDGFEAMILLNDQSHRVDPHERAIIIEEHLRSINPEWTDGWFEYDFANSRLRLGGKGLRRLSDSGSIVAGLQPKTLDISGSEIETLWKETSYAIETLDMRGCPLKEPNVLLRFLHLKRLVILPGQLAKEHLVMLPDWVEVIESELNSTPGEPEP
ncbi:MAG: protein kinase [Planctomycetota bacterium]